MSEPLISVVMAVYNDDRFLRQSIESILEQEFTDFEFIIINDGSTDNSLSIIRKYEKYDQRIKIINNTTNVGLARSLNSGIRMAKGKYIARHDSDDIALKSRLKRQSEHILQYQHVKVLGSKAIKINEFGIESSIIHVPLSHEVIMSVIPRKNPFIHPSVIVEKQALIDIGLYNEQLLRTQDYELWYRMLKKHQCENLDEPLVKYRIYPEGMKKKSYKHRILEARIKMQGINYLGLNKLNYMYALKPLIVGLIPETILFKHYLK